MQRHVAFAGFINRFNRRPLIIHGHQKRVIAAKEKLAFEFQFALGQNFEGFLFGVMRFFSLGECDYYS